MPVLTLLKLFLSIASSLAQYAQNKQLLEAGAAQSVLEGIKYADDAILRANNARLHANELPVNEDPNNRDA